MESIEYTRKEVPEALLEKLKHPYFPYAKIQLESVTWEVKCKTCGGIHLIGTEHDELLDRCCEKPRFMEI